MTDIILRAPRLDEAAAMAAFGRDIFIETFGHIYTPEDLATFIAETYTADILARFIADPAIGIRVAEVAGATGAARVWAGYVRVSPNTMPFAVDGRKTAELKQLYVFKAWHGQGIAEQLMDWAMAELKAQGFEDVLLSVFSENPRAQKFYQRHGFAKIANYFFMVGKQKDVEFVYRAILA